MSAGEVRLSYHWKMLLGVLDAPRFKARLERNLVTAGNRIGRQFQREARSLIRAKAYAPNSPVTVILKGSSTPLVDRGDLFQQITFAVPDPYNVQLGIMRRAVGDRQINVAAVLHEGQTIKVTPKIRAAVFAKVRDGLSASRLAALNPRSRSAVRGAAAAMGLAQRRAMHARRAMGTPKLSGRGAEVWIVPGRPFIARPASDPAWQRFAVDQYAQAVFHALRSG